MNEWSRLRIDFVSWLQFYDRIYSHPEKPSADVIDDDEALDAWIRLQEHKARKSEMESRLRSGGSKSTGKEVFI